MASRRDQRGSRYDVNGRILEIERDGVAEGGRRNCKPNEPKLRTPGSPNLFFETGVGDQMRGIIRLLKTGSIPQVEIEQGTSLHPSEPPLEKVPRKVRPVAAAPS